MPVVQPRVELLAHTPEPLSLVYAAFRQCYHAGFVADMWPRLLAGDIGREKQAQFVASIMESGHASPVEHVSFTFALGGVSRALTHQLVRHRIASYSQQSQRYVDGSDFDYLIPPELAEKAVPGVRVYVPSSFSVMVNRRGCSTSLSVQSTRLYMLFFLHPDHNIRSVYGACPIPALQIEFPHIANVSARVNQSECRHVAFA